MSTFRELKQNKFSSYWYMIERFGDREMRNLVSSVIDINEDVWGEVDMNGLTKLNIR